MGKNLGRFKWNAIYQYFTQPNFRFTKVVNVNSPTFSLTKTLKWLIRQSFTPWKFCAIRYIPRFSLPFCILNFTNKYSAFVVCFMCVYFGLLSSKLIYINNYYIGDEVKILEWLLVEASVNLFLDVKTGILHRTAGAIFHSQWHRARGRRQTMGHHSELPWSCYLPVDTEFSFPSQANWEISLNS